MAPLVSLNLKNNGKTRSNAIDRQIEKESRSCQKVNILLLGSDPEMSQIPKEMKIQHGLTNDERMHYRLTIYRNILDSAKILVRAMRDLALECADPTNRVKIDCILDYHIQHSPSSVLSSEVTVAIYHLWQDPNLPKVVDRLKGFPFAKSVEYFFKDILRIGSPDYLPTNNDILQVRGHLSQVVETSFSFGALQITIVDPRRQHNRAKWINYIEHTSYIIFCVSLSDYDLVLEGNNDWNHLSDSFILFESVANSRWFTHTSIILLLTNVEAFENKLSKVPLKRFLPDYAGGAGVDDAIEYIQSRFLLVNRKGLPVYFIQHRSVQASTDLVFQIVKNTALADAWKDFRKAPTYSAAMRVLRLRPACLPDRSSRSLESTLRRLQAMTKCLSGGLIPSCGLLNRLVPCARKERQISCVASKWKPVFRSRKGL